MKKLQILLAMASFMALTSLVPVAFSDGSGAGIENSPHDFSDLAANSWNTREEICRSCHVPHDHQRDIYQTGLLWNHASSQATYNTYTSLDGTVTGQPDGISKLCLGCHDGTVGIDEWDGKNIDAGTVFILDYDSGFQVPGVLPTANDLSRTHPLSVVYSYDATDPDGLNDPTAPMGTSGTINEVLENGKVQCSSCHDVHDNEAVGATHLLRVSQKASMGQASGLCLTCHNK